MGDKPLTLLPLVVKPSQKYDAGVLPGLSGMESKAQARRSR
jgi:hypothetical protein